MDEEALRALREAVAPGRISTALDDRICYSRDQWPRGLLWTLQGEPARHPPDAVAWPVDGEGVARVLGCALQRRIPVIPFGGGSGVAGGTVPTWGGLLLDTKELDQLEEVDPEGLSCVAGAGIVGQHLELQLERHGLTLGHFPSSIFCSCLGGWLAARSAGQMSSRYGKIEDMVLAAEVALPQGRLVRFTRSEAGPGWLQALVGSEGTLGVFTRAWLRVQPLPPTRLFSSWSFPDVESGCEAMRQILQAGMRPAVVRLYDPFDTLLAGGRDARPASEPAAPPPPRRRPGAQLPLELLRRTLSRSLAGPLLLGQLNRLADLAPAGCLLILVHEGQPELAAAEVTACAEICRLLGGEDAGPEHAAGWYRRRYVVSYKQSRVYDAGLFVDTMEVAATWDRLLPLYRAVRHAISPFAFVMAHFSHAYAEGCSIYFTFVGPGLESNSEERYLQLWRTALAAASAAGGTLSHHHGVGELKAAFMEREVGPAGRQLFTALKQTLDPAGGMNPGKLWPREPGADAAASVAPAGGRRG